LFDRIRLALNTPASPFYAPKIVATSSNPPLEPYTAERIELGPQSIDSIDFDAANLLNANIRGFSNASVPEAKLRITGARVDAEVDIGALAHPPVVSDNTGRKIQVPPPPLAIQADFELDLSGSPLPGKANVTIANASVLATANFSGADDTTLEIGFSALSLRADLGGMKIALQIDSDFQEDVNQIVNQNSIKQRVVDGINAKAAPQLGQIGQTATKEARAAIVAQLGS
jgi:hypothetical protein